MLISILAVSRRITLAIVRFSLATACSLQYAVLRMCLDRHLEHVQSTYIRAGEDVYTPRAHCLSKGYENGTSFEVHSTRL